MITKADFERLFNENIENIRQFFINTIKAKTTPKTYKLSFNCPYCEKPDTKHHLVINLDWGVIKCFRCGKSTSILSFLYNLSPEYYHAYINFLQELMQIPLYSVLMYLKRGYIKAKSNSEFSSTNSDLYMKYIKDNGLVSIAKLRNAVIYAAKRTRKNKDEISTYYADESYIYIPIFKKQEVAALMARKYTDISSGSRYKVIKFTNESIAAFLDEVESNFSCNTVYLTEGYFDAFAINNSFMDYRAIAIFSKSESYEIINELTAELPPETNIIIALDSKAKDPYIEKSIDRLYKQLKDYFDNISICLLKEGDPNQIFVDYGPIELINQLENCTISAGEYLKRKTMSKGKSSIKENPEDLPIKVPSILLKLRKKYKEEAETNDN